MEQPPPHPLPPSDLHHRPLPLLMTERVWIRSHSVCYEALYFGRSGKNRFDAPGKEYGVLYVAADIHGAFIETFGRELGRMLISRQELRLRALAEVSVARSLRLVDLSGVGLVRVGADSRLTSGSYSVSQPWALALHAHPERPDGVLFRSRHDPGRLCAAVFDRAADVLTTRPLGLLADGSNAAQLGQILDAYGYSLVDDDTF